MEAWGLLAGTPGWVTLVAVSGLCGLLVLDDTAWGQTWFSQPLPAALLTGLVCGEPLTGLAIGLPLQLVMVGNIPVGQTFLGDSTVAVSAAVAAAALTGHHLDPALVFGDPGLPLLGWLVVGAALLSLGGNFLVQAERRAHVPLMLEGHRTLRDGDLGRINRLHHRALVMTFFRGSLGCLLGVLVLTGVWIPLLGLLPAPLHRAAGIVVVLLPGLGVGTMIDRYGLQRSLPWVGAGLVAGGLMAGVLR